MYPRFEYLRPRTLEEALRLHGAREEASYIAGGTDLLVQMKGGSRRPRTLVSLRRVEGLAGIEAGEGDGLSIGAATPLADVAADARVREGYPLLAQAAASVGSLPIRNTATLGGNLCNASPCANSAPPLLVLDAVLELAGPGGRRRVPIRDFFVGPGATGLGPGELLTRVELSPPAPRTRGVFLKQGRVAVDLALASVAVVLEVEADGRTCRRARVGAGAVGPTPLALERVEALLAGQPLTPERVARAAALAREDIAPIDDVRASAEHRRALTGVLLERALWRLMGLREDPGC